MGEALAAATPQDWIRWEKLTRLHVRKLLPLVCDTAAIRRSIRMRPPKLTMTPQTCFPAGMRYACWQFNMDTLSGPIISTCWIIFLVYWVVSAFKVKVTAEPQSLPSALAHRIPVGLGWFLMVYRGFPPPMNTLLTPHTNGVMAFGVLVCLFGLLVTLWARWTLAGNWSSDVTFKQNHELVRTGPYRLARHPIYTGLLLMCLGTAMNAGHLRSWIAVVVIGVGFWIKLSQEEQLLLRHFPDSYPAYRKQVKALVPFVL